MALRVHLLGEFHVAAGDTPVAALAAPLPSSTRPAYARTIAAARAQLGDTTFAAAWAVGSALDLDQAIACALGDDDR